MDFFLIETMSALEEVEAAVEGIWAASSLPIVVTMTFDNGFPHHDGRQAGAGGEGALRHGRACPAPLLVATAPARSSV